MPNPPELTRRRLLLAVFEIIAWPGLIVLLGGDYTWLQGWAFALWFIALCGTCMYWLYHKDPALLMERLRPAAAAQKSWDRYLLGSLALLIGLWFVIIPLDAVRFSWTMSWPTWARTVGAVALALASFFLFRSVTDNTFLSPVVRMQSEREHKLVSTGVYGFVRHPMYLGGSLMMCGGPLFLGSAWGLGIGLLTLLLLVMRIVGEERMLARELAGYPSYQQHVRYRLLPLVW